MRKLLREEEDPCSRLLNDKKSTVVHPGVITAIEGKIGSYLNLRLIEGGKDCCYKADDSLKAEDIDDLSVGLLFKFTHLELGGARIHHDLGLVSGIDGHAQDPLCVTEGASPQENVFAIECKCNVSCVVVALESVNLVVRLLAS